MRIEHLAIWASDPETMKDFYVKYFNMECSAKYSNVAKQFTSYFLSFPLSSARIEIMHRPGITQLTGDKGTTNGLTHFAISVGSKELVDALTEKMRAEGVIIYSEPRTTGDGYYESVVLDTEGNHVEITI